MKIEIQRSDVWTADWRPRGEESAEMTPGYPWYPCHSLKKETTMETAEEKRVIIPLTDRSPVSIIDANWPEIASAERSGNDSLTAELPTKLLWHAFIRVRRNIYGRILVHGEYSCMNGQECVNAGFLLDDSMGLSKVIYDVAGQMNRLGAPKHVTRVLASECFNRLPVEELD